MLCVQRTGWGKSAVYFIATALLRERGAGPACRHRPLLALMRNQIAAAERLGIRALTMNSTNRDDWEEVQRLLAEDAVDLLLISPERLNNPEFRDGCCRCSSSASGCSSSTRRTASRTGATTSGPTTAASATMLERLPAASRCCARRRRRTTASWPTSASSCAVGHAGDAADLPRPARAASLRLEVVDLPGRADRLAWLATWLPQLHGSGIVYSLTKRDAEPSPSG